MKCIDNSLLNEQGVRILNLSSVSFHKIGPLYRGLLFTVVAERMPEKEQCSFYCVQSYVINKCT